MSIQPCMLVQRSNAETRPSAPSSAISTRATVTRGAGPTFSYMPTAGRDKRTAPELTTSFTLGTSARSVRDSRLVIFDFPAMSS